MQESWSLRCATRGHECGGANLTYPTQASFEKDFSDSKARIDSCDPEETGKPDHPMPADGAADRTAFDLAFGWGAYGGLRIKAFLNEFPESLTFSICERDYSKAMKQIGEALAAKLGPTPAN